MNHLDRLKLKLSNERLRLDRATNCQEISLRQVWVKQIEREIASEYAFLGNYWRNSQNEPRRITKHPVHG